MKKGKKLFWFWMIFYILVIMADGVLTYIGTPDLALEGNPLVSKLGLGWGALFIANMTALLMVAALLYYAFVKYEHPYIPYKTYKQYASMLHNNSPDRFTWTFCKLPRDLDPTLAAFCFGVGIAVILSRIILVAEWILHIIDSPWYGKYNEFKRSLPRLAFAGHRLDLWVGLVLIFWLPIFWHIKKYLNNRNLVKEKNDGQSLTEKPKVFLIDDLLSAASILWRQVLALIFQNILVVMLIIKGAKYLFRKKSGYGGQVG